MAEGPSDEGEATELVASIEPKKFQPFSFPRNA